MKINRVITSFILISFCLTFFGSAGRAQVCSPLPSGIVAWYKGESNVNDSSENGHHGANSFSLSFASGHVGQAFSFSDQTQSAPIPNHPSLFPPTSLTIEGWVNPLPYSNCSGDSYRIFHTVQTAITGYATIITCPAGNFVGALFDSTGTPEAVVSTAPIPTNTFTHFAVTWDGSNLRLYINGILDSVAPTTMTAIGTNEHFLRIGNAQAIGFLGKIDEVSLYNRALSGSEVAAIFSAGTAGKCVTISGRIFSASGRGIAGTRVILSNKNGVVRTTMSSTFGYYRLSGVSVGQTYTLEPTAKQHTFSPRMIAVNDSLTGEDFIALP